jgi:hypothetical protein
MMNKPKKEDGPTSFVRIDNSNMIKLTIKQLAKLYTKYAKTVLEIKRLNDARVDLRKSLYAKIAEMDTDYAMLVENLPKAPKEIHVRKPAYPVEKIQEEPEVEYESPKDTFETLRAEFEKIRGELEKIR